MNKLIIAGRQFKSRLMVGTGKFQSSSVMKEALDEKCSLTSEGLATCFENSLKIKSKYSNRIEVADGSVYQFYGDGFCKNSGDCYIAVDVNGDVRPNLDDVDRIVVPLYVNENGYLRVDSEALTKYIQSQ